jgi:hypothetical protein
VLGDILVKCLLEKLELGALPAILKPLGVKRLNIDPKAIRKWVCQGRLKSVLEGKSQYRLFRRKDVEQLRRSGSLGLY